ncbi:clamp loader of DNA polymerase [Serratia phage 92A1]|nr:clamp loader of DNA polymerase [Serratia phage 92A1]
MLTVTESEFMWEQKYRPSTIDECILPAADKKIFEQLIKDKRIPHLILHSSSPGTGKTTVARALAAGIDAEMMFVNGADCKIDFIRNELTRFASSKSLTKSFKVIIIDEYDRSGLADAQRHLRSFMEAYSSNCAIIITANDIEGIIPALRSRARVIHFGKPTEADERPMMGQMLKRLEKICENESVVVEDRRVLAALVKKNFPEFRKTINTLDFYSKHGVIDAGILSVVLNTSGSIQEVIDALKNKEVKTLRALAPKYAADYSAFVGKLAKELYELLTGPSILRMYEIIGENNQYHGVAANIELHVTYMLIQLAVDTQWK